MDIIFSCFFLNKFPSLYYLDLDTLNNFIHVALIELQSENIKSARTYLLSI